MEQARIFIVDDDERLRELLVEYLSGRDFAVQAAVDAEEALQLLEGGAEFDLMVFDVMLPGMDGFDLLKTVRRRWKTPVIMLTARGDELDRIVGLEIGADDYMHKPFNPRELLARAQAILRRTNTEPTEDDKRRLSAGAIEVNLDQRQIRLRGEALELTTTEFEILRTLVANAGRVINRERLMELARGEEFASFDRSVDVHISHIRKKLGDDPRNPTYLKTVRGVGYTIPKKPEDPS